MCGLMSTRISKELADAFRAAGEHSLEVVDPSDNRVYFLVDGETHRRAMDALQQQLDREAIADGLAQMDAGEGKPIEVAFEDMQAKLGFPHRQ